MSDPVRIVLCGATGRTGNAVAHALVGRDDTVLAAVVAPSVAATPTRPLPEGVAAFASLVDAIDAGAEGVVVDLTHAEPALANMELALERGRTFVLGATGIDEEQLRAVGGRFTDAGLGLLHVPNFSIGAVLAMQCAELLARHFPDVEVIETHHAGKRDAPSGTAIRTAQLVSQARGDAGAPAAVAGADGSRGECWYGVPVHALRLPGATAHQEVVFGAPGELVTIRHDAIDRSAYATGVALAARYASTLHGYETGLEQAL